MKIYSLIEKLGQIRGLPQFLFIDAIHPESMVRVRSAVMAFKIDNPDTNEIDFIIHSPGGSPADAYRIIRTLRNNFEKVNIIIPFWVKSAATLLSLGGNEIIMDEFGEFGPLDIQIGVERDDSPEIDRESALNDEYSVRRIEARSQELYYQMFLSLYSSDDIKINKNELSKQLLEFLSSFYRPLLSQINPYHLGRKKRMLDIGEQYAQRILMTYNPTLPQKNRDHLIDYLVNRCPDHGYVIDYNLISIFLNNVKLSSKVSNDYKIALSDVCTELMIMGDFNFIGFIEQSGTDVEDDKTSEDTEKDVNIIKNSKSITIQTKPPSNKVIPKKVNSKIDQNGTSDN